MIYALIYLASIVGVNMLFAKWPELSWLWSFVVGTVFVTRDYAQRAMGHWVLAFMAAAAVISWFMASPFVATASVAAFAASELIDWAVYTWTKRPFRDRMLISSHLSVPVDSAVFLLVAGFFSWPVFLVQILAKLFVAWIVFFLREDIDNENVSLRSY